MGLRQAVSSVFRKYGVFKGRARRSEYWMFFLFNILVGIAVTIGVSVLGGVGISRYSNDSYYSGGGALGAAGILWILYLLYGVAIIIPSFALACRRLHDIGRSGAYILFGLIPVVGWIFLLIWSLQDGDPNPNQYGPSPKANAYAYTPPTPAPAASPAVPAAPAAIPERPYAAPEEPAREDEPDGYGGWPDADEPDTGGWPEQMPETAPVAAAPVRKTMTPVVRSLAEQHGNRKVRLDGEALVLGRASGCKIAYKDGTPGVSGRHCAILWDPGRERFLVKDMSSTYGTYMENGRRLEPEKLYSLRPGESIYLGEKANKVRLEVE